MIRRTATGFATRNERHDLSLQTRQHLLFSHERASGPASQHLIIDQLSQYDTTDMESLAKNVFNLSPEGKGYQQACLKLLRFEAEHCQALIDLTQGDTTSHEAFANAIQSYHHQQRPPRQCHLIYRSKC